ncbi:hypothetical protein JOC78_003223 [Bacillus ectoiniformans]|uniref:DUF4083 domain-containing protein n=1 Tax=Bacillus ectoiniformans TaxID=1494429 RepID=UPI00195A715D|nr:DUF4083 domain-containing protein [Bacillus ectoiniformans]MBM7650238.1 hypothetical protein [Bacillus ectoiniformans]
MNTADLIFQLLMLLVLGTFISLPILFFRFLKKRSNRLARIEEKIDKLSKD